MRECAEQRVTPHVLFGARIPAHDVRDIKEDEAETMGTYGTLYAVAAPELTLLHDEFSAMVLETRREMVAQEPSAATWEVLIASGDEIVGPSEKDPRLYELSGVWIPYNLKKSGALTFPYHGDDSGHVVVWYEGADQHAIEAALRQLPYGVEDVYARFALGPAYYALAQPREVVFANATDGEIMDTLIATQFCRAGSMKNQAPPLSMFPFARVIKRYYRVVQSVYTFG